MGQSVHQNREESYKLYSLWMKEPLLSWWCRKPTKKSGYIDCHSYFHELYLHEWRYKTSCFCLLLLFFNCKEESGNACNITVSALFKMKRRKNTTASSTTALATRETGLIELFLSWPSLIIYWEVLEMNKYYCCVLQYSNPLYLNLYLNSNIRS